MKRFCKIHQVDSITGEIVIISSKEYNHEIYEHKKQFLAMCESFWEKHFSNPALALELYVFFPEIREELSLPF